MVPEYRLHVLDEHGQLMAAVKLDCTDDRAAKECAMRLADRSEVQLWRLIARFRTDDPPQKRRRNAFAR
ncbi:hypothetical protein [Bradyrhizobium sp. NAS80.1]|uniref:hypothetical protein n=1 Tax=Bradyrhizobium sp. NAS80.1 TaxID=1680159 RepID=UPI001160FBDA|nr:hypothetical protein [Bradyrhizobium sp. NAS80.1]